MALQRHIGHQQHRRGWRSALAVVVGGIGLAAWPLSLSAQQACFLRSQETFGQTKTCIYDCKGQQMRTTVSSLQVCPLTIGDTNPALMPSPWSKGPAGIGVPRAEQPPALGEEGAPPGGAAAQPGAVPPARLGAQPPTLPTLPQAPASGK
jgi:hypothetical protein